MLYYKKAQGPQLIIVSVMLPTTGDCVTMLTKDKHLPPGLLAISINGESNRNLLISLIMTYNYGFKTSNTIIKGEQ